MITDNYFILWSCGFEYLNEIMDIIREHKDIKITTNHFTYSINGLYEHADSKSGGPIIGYIYPSNKDTSLCLLGFVNYPGHEKMNLLYQLSAIFNTIERGQNE